MTLRGRGLSCLRNWSKYPRRKRYLLLLLLIITLMFIVEEVGRRIILATSLYSLNLHANISQPIMPAPTSNDKILIFAPHEDDETLGCAGYIQQAIKAGAQVHIVLMTNGEYPEISVVLFQETLRLSSQAFLKLGYMRQHETIHAMQYLGLSRNAITFLGYPNQYLNQMWLPRHWRPADPVRSVRTRATHSPYKNSFTKHAAYAGQSVLDDVEALLLRDKPNIVITLQPNDIHVDHWPTYTFVQYALNELALRGNTFASQSKVFTYLIHRDYWPVPRGYYPTYNLEPPAKLAKVGGTDWLARPLTVAETIDKHKATALYHTQGGSFDPLLLSFARANELYGVIPSYRWPAKSTVTRTTIIKDPAADLTSSALNAHGDIVQVWLKRQQNSMIVFLQTRGDISPRVTYHFSLHAGGRSVKDRVIVEYDWKGRIAKGLLYKYRSLKPITSRELSISRRGNLTLLRAQWPLTDDQQFFLVRAWTTYGRRTVDQTITNTFQISNVSMSNKALKFHEEQLDK